MRTFCAGLAHVPSAIRYIAKLDADVSVPPDYFARLVGELEGEPRLGLVSGACRQWTGRAWQGRYPSSGVIRGAARVYRRECLDELLPLEERVGWDGIDSVKARLLGWGTRELGELPFYHHRGVGAREGRLRAGMALGGVAHYLRYRPSYLVLRTLFRTSQDWSALAVPAGYLRATLRHEARSSDVDLVARIRELQRWRNVPLRWREATADDDRARRAAQASEGA